ncbi:TonB-dependent hemoglobin/transferrin/lactoferrin family receptor [Aureimonas sp. ME7]|uniref:TonB-dependent hemoglobin/transferrin/lactoferrin family receptor n=1 Tax=Aureimonas sp. ME7 TaxID=2744252 RepID=UPI0015F47D87|nr:TonB-dependent hemoglobin/transferrin/lactoferrin family receptor [Aureimonas sp. ME7]
MRCLKVSLSLGVAASAMLASATLAQDAQTSDDAMNLEAVVVTGGAQASEPAGTVTTTTTGRTTLDDRQIDDIGDIGRTEEAGVSFNRVNNSLNIRGLDGSRVLTTVDGVRVPYLLDATRGASGGIDTIDFNALSSLDITRGADPLLGSGALGGVLAVRTLEPGDLLLGGRRIGALSKSGYDSTDRSWFTSNAVALRAGDTTALLQGSYRGGHETDSQGTIDAIGPARTEPNPRDYDTYSLLGKLYQDIEGGHRLGITAEIYHRQDDFETRTTQSETGTYRRGDHFSGEEVERRKVALSYDYEAPARGEGFLDEARAVLYYQGIDRNSTVDARRTGTLPGIFTRDNSNEEEAFGFNAHAAKDWQLGSLDQRLVFGTELRTAKTTQYSAGIDGCLVTPSNRSCGNLHTNQADTPEVESNLVGLFAENETRLFGDRLRLTPGIRFDWYENTPELTPEFESSAAYDGTLPDASSDTAVSPKFLAEYDVAPGLTLYGQWSRGFRAPTVGELYSRFGAVGTYLRIGNEDLEAERSNGFDAGIRAGDEDLGGRLNVFTTRYRNFIDTVTLAPPGGLYPQGGVSSYENIPDARISGVEFAGHVRFLDHWRARASLAYAEGRNLTDDTYLDSVSPLTAILGLGYEERWWGGEVSTKLAARRDKVDDGFKAPGYGVVDLTAWVEPEALPGLKITGGIFNLFDKTFYDAVSVPDSRSQPDLYYSEPGRAFKLNAIYRF